MDSSVASCLPVTPAKRPFAGESEPRSPTLNSPKSEAQLPSIIQAPTSPLSMGSAQSSKPMTLPNGVSRQASPALSNVSTLTSVSATPPPPFGFDGSTQSTQQAASGQSATLSGQPPSAKRRKLTPAEQEERKLEKEQKERDRVAQKAKREEEKQVKDEERRQKNEIKEQKKREKEIEKQRAEEQKRKVEEEKEKKERAQKRINSFFVTPKESPNAPKAVANDRPALVDTSNLVKDASATPPAGRSDYRRTFLPFALPSNTIWAPASQFTWDYEAVQHIQDLLDHAMPVALDAHRIGGRMEIILGLCPAESKGHGIIHEPVKDIIRRLASSEAEPAGLPSAQSDNPLQALQKVPMRYIHFSEDVRPPYIGTYTKVGGLKLSRASRNPFSRTRPDTDYDYDSEAEWEEPEDGEDILSEVDSELESNDGADDMEDFLDDEDADGQSTKKRVISSDLEPVCSGLCWEDGAGVSLDSSGQTVETALTKLSLLQDCVRLPIDPFSTLYWQDREKEAKSGTKQISSAMQPPRQPLQTRPNIFVNAPVSAVNNANTPESKPKKSSELPARLLTGSELEAFKEAVTDSEHTKIGLLAILKKQFPKIPKTVLQDTLGTYAERQGRVEAEKKWRIKGEV